MFGARQQLHNNTVYPLLSRLMEEGFITQKEKDGERGQTRLLYELTAAGRRYLKEKLAMFNETDAENEGAFRLRVGLFDLLDPASRRRILELRDAYLALRLKRLQGIGANRNMKGWPGESFGFVISSVEREREWIKGLLKKVVS